MSKTSGQILQEARKNKELSQDTLGNLVGCGKAKISKLENGSQIMTPEWAKRLAPHVGLKPYQLLPDLAFQDEQNQLVKNINRLEESEREIVETFVDSLLQKHGKHDRK